MTTIRDLFEAGAPHTPPTAKAWGEAISDAVDGGNVHVANDGVAITDPNFPRPNYPLVIWPMANGVEPTNAVFPDIINTATPSP